MSEMVERVARAMVMANGFDPDERVYGVTRRVDAYLPTVRAAIAAIGEPTEVMSVAGCRKAELCGILLSIDKVETIFRAMIDEALK